MWSWKREEAQIEWVYNFSVATFDSINFNKKRKFVPCTEHDLKLIS
jgi:hypothetical protein